jgi:hypothetical protein
LAEEDTRKLLKTGGWLLAAGALCLVLIETVGGGISQHGVHTNSAWLLLVAALSCLPLGVVLCLLGGAKWLGKRGR